MLEEFLIKYLGEFPAFMLTMIVGMTGFIIGIVLFILLLVYLIERNLKED